jgi:hypothetical protein
VRQLTTGIGEFRAGRSRVTTLTAALWAMWLAFAAVPGARASDLTPQTAAAFDHYLRATEAKMNAIPASQPFLAVDRLPDGPRNEAAAELRDGKIWIEKLETLENGEKITAPGGLIHHWTATVFIPGVTLAQTLALEEDYNAHAKCFQPDVVGSKILHRSGNDFEVYLRFHKQKVVSAVLDTTHSVHYQLLSATRAASESHTTRIQEVQGAGTAKEHLEPEGHDDGFLWRMNTYWRFEEKNGGTYVESETISLTRDIPAGLGWVVGPFIDSIPKQSLTFTLETTRNVLLNRLQGR